MNADDDRLLDALARGDAEPSADSLAPMLAAWREDIAADLPDFTLDAPPPAPRRFRLAIAAALVLVAAASLGFLAANASPDSPLWPLTRLLAPEHAAEELADRNAETLLEDARRALAEGDVAEVRRLLSELEGLIPTLTDEVHRDHLVSQVLELRGQLPPVEQEPTEQPELMATPPPPTDEPDESDPTTKPKGPKPPIPTPEDGADDEQGDEGKDPEPPVPTLPGAGWPGEGWSGEGWSGEDLPVTLPGMPDTPSK
ncbi:hypothetical protein AB0I28_29020 [Phytomonospora sp. NPDC050363]|uniref:hypothetical protein n=1 Tax=Phytomonospora sp. NPDC050363 TaxID=3155642 RepID=UPI0033F6EEA8